MIDVRSLDKDLVRQYRSQMRSRLEAERSVRLSWWTHWSQLAEVYLPRRYKWFITPNNYTRGSAINSSIIDETGVLAARTLASGMMSGLTSPTKPWFKLGLHDLKLVQFGPIKQWLAECERRLLIVFAESNFYQCLGTLYHDNGVFGSAAMLVYEDFNDVIRCYNPCLGEFFFSAGPRLDITNFYREFTLTVAQTVDMFGINSVCESTRNAYKNGGGTRTYEIIIQHGIEPNTMIWDGDKPVGYLVPKEFAYREVYWEITATSTSICAAAGYYDKPFVPARWDTVSNDPYGRSLGMDGLPANRQLQVEQRRKGEAIDKFVRPPMNASVNMKNEPTSILPGAVNYVVDVKGSGFVPAISINPQGIGEVREDITEVQNRLKSIFFVDLFMMISELDTVRTATEIDARREEKLIQLGPVIERFENEVLDPMIHRIFNIMLSRRLLPPPPPELGNAKLNVQYVSMLAEAQRAASTAAIERLLALVGNISAANPEAIDNVDLDETVEVYADLLSVTPKIIRAMKEVMQIRAVRAKQQQQQQAMQASMAAAQGAKTLSDTQVGGGINALQAMQGAQTGMQQVAA